MAHLFAGYQPEEYEILERRIASVQDDSILVWWLIPTEDAPQGMWAPFLTAIDGVTVKEWPLWAPLPGSQNSFLSSPVFETMLAGSRGGGKSASLLMDFAKECGKGWGSAWRGILFRLELGDLDEMVRKTEELYKPIFPGFRFLQSKADYAAVWPDGERLLFRHLKDLDEYKEYHGHQYDLPYGEVLTVEEGWKPIANVQIGERIYSESSEREIVETVVEQKIEYEYCGDMIVVDGRGIHLAMTPQHAVAAVQTDGSIKSIPYEELPRWQKVARWGEWLDGTEIARFDLAEIEFRSSRPSGKNPGNLSGDDYCEFMGWFLSEGSTRRPNQGDGSRYGAICVCQEKEPQRTVIKALLNRIGLFFSEQGSDFVFYDPRWWVYLQTFGKCRDKFVPIEIKNTTERQLRIFFNALMAGDGTWQGDNGYYHTTSKRLADDVAEIAFKLGYAVYVSSRQRDSRTGLSWCVACRSGDRRDFLLKTDNRKRNRAISKNNKLTNVNREHYEGKTYCLGIPEHHTFIIRQKGCVWVSGNCWLGFEELTQWPDPKAYLSMFSTCRPTTSGIPVRVRSNTNPSGSGHNWVKKRFQLPGMFGRIIRMPGDEMRVAINSHLDENFVLLHTDPNYKRRVVQAASSAAQAKAWGEGDWEITEGGIIDDLWKPQVHIVPNISATRIPPGWKISRSYDHGQARPFCVLWFAESNGEPIRLPDGRYIGQVRGDLLIFAEWYGTNGQENTGIRMPPSSIAQGIKDRERDFGINFRCIGGPADTEIWSRVGSEVTRAPIDDFEDKNVYWDKADKSHGSRVRGLTQLRELVDGAVPHYDGTRDKPGIFVCVRCKYWLELVPSMPRDTDNPDDVPPTYEDHPIDATRYRLSWEFKGMNRRSF